MQTKLTLRIEEDIIKKAKKYARANGKSVSKVVSDYFEMLSANDVKEKQKIGSITQSLTGLFSDTDLSELDYKRYIEKKHL